MGTIYYGIVEKYEAPWETVGGHRMGGCWWTVVDDVHFNKDYALSNALDEAGANQGWPKDCSIAAWEIDKRFIEEGMRTVTLPQFEKAIAALGASEDGRGSTQARATLAFMKAMQDSHAGRSGEVRLLMYSK
jgi:hypothetical protein